MYKSYYIIVFLIFICILTTNKSRIKIFLSYSPNCVRKYLFIILFNIFIFKIEYDFGFRLWWFRKKGCWVFFYLDRDILLCNFYINEITQNDSIWESNYYFLKHHLISFLRPISRSNNKVFKKKQSIFFN